MTVASKNFHPRKVTLKNGSSILVRVPECSEAQKLVTLKRSYIKENRTIPLILEEYPDDVHEEEILISKYQSSSNSILLIAEANNMFIGNIDLTGNKRKKVAHTAVIGMGIREEWRNQGLGKILLESVIDWAKSYSTLKTVWLEVYASNEAGLALYEKVGFSGCGRMPEFFNEEGNYIDKIQMYLSI